MLIWSASVKWGSRRLVTLVVIVCYNNRVTRVDPSSPVPLFHQIAEAIRARIEVGELAPGEALEPLREAAERWGVNLHTVRHAYTALAREGLVETRGTRGTRVRRLRPKPAGESRDAFLRRFTHEARERHRIGPAELAREVARLGHLPVGETVYVVECSAHQCEQHAEELRARFDVDAREWSLERNAEPPAGTVVSTYFHYNDVRRLWPHRLREVRFITITPDAALAGRVERIGGVRRVLVCERDAATAENVAADVSTVLSADHFAIEPFVIEQASQALARCDEETVALFSPRIWASLEETDRQHPRALQARYVMDEGELDELGRFLGWAAAA